MRESSPSPTDLDYHEIRQNWTYSSCQCSFFGYKVQHKLLKSEVLHAVNPVVISHSLLHFFRACFCVAVSVAENDRMMTVKRYGLAVKRMWIKTKKIAVKP